MRDFSFSVGRGEIACLIGRNGAGKTSLLRAIMGLLKLRCGEIWWNDVRLDILSAHSMAGLGVAIVPQGRRLFAEMNVTENIDIGLRARGRLVRQQYRENREKLWDLFPVLRERRHQIAATLSGGEQQMLAFARAMAVSPSLLLLDEPSEGLQPSMLEHIGDIILRLKSANVAVVLVEQRLDLALRLGDSFSFIENGEFRERVAADQISAQSPQFKHYVGV